MRKVTPAGPRFEGDGLVDPEVIVAIGVRSTRHTGRRTGSSVPVTAAALMGTLAAALLAAFGPR
jgi:hypothetical protein